MPLFRAQFPGGLRLRRKTVVPRPRLCQVMASMVGIDNFDGDAPVDLDQLAAFDRIVREGGFGRAALALGIGQPAVSARIRTLEDRSGCRPTSRSGHGSALEPAEGARRDHDPYHARDSHGPP